MRREVEFTHRGIQVGEKEIPLYSGSIHYWRMEREHWGKALDEIRALGFSIVETYLPWGVHEPERGAYDFGEKDPRKDVEGFLRLCEEKGLYVIVRPGPHINAEMTLFGYPRWLLEDPEIQARNPQGSTVVYPYVTKQFPIPSYASDKLYQETECYFQKLAPMLRRHCYPQGGIIAIQADNETCNFFRDRPYIMDYSHWSRQLFHSFLRERYGELSRLNEVYYTAYSDWEEVPLPTGYREGEENLSPYFDWVEYKEYQILDSLRRMLGILERMELPVPVFHNCAYQNYTPISLQRDEELTGLSVAGIDAYPEPGDTAMLKERIRFLAGSSRLPFVPEFGSGSWFDRGMLLSPQEEAFGYLYSFMNGLKAVNFYMLVERDRWTGCPIQNDGTPRKEWGEMFQALLKLLKENDIYKYRREPKILVLKNYDMGRLKALLSCRDRNLFSSNCLIKGPDIPGELFAPKNYRSLERDPLPGHYGREKWIEGVMRTLDALHLEYDLSDGFVPEEKLAAYEWVFASAYDWMEPDMQEKLAVYAELPGRHLCIGPHLPFCDRRGDPCCRLAQEMARDLVWWVQKPEKIRELPLPKAEYSCEETEVEFSVHKEPETGEELLYAANISGDWQTVKITYKGFRRFCGRWSAQDTEGNEEIIAHFHPFEIKLWKVTKEEYHAG